MTELKKLVFVSNKEVQTLLTKVAACLVICEEGTDTETLALQHINRFLPDETRIEYRGINRADALTQFPEVRNRLGAMPAFAFFVFGEPQTFFVGEPSAPDVKLFHDES